MGKKADQRMAKIAFLGLGVMGYPMAGHLEYAEHDVTVWNPASTIVNSF